MFPIFPKSLLNRSKETNATRGKQKTVHFIDFFIDINIDHSASPASFTNQSDYKTNIICTVDSKRVRVIGSSKRATEKEKNNELYNKVDFQKSPSTDFISQAWPLRGLKSSLRSLRNS